MPYYYYNDIYSLRYVLLIAAILLTVIAQARVSSNFRKYSSVRNRRGMTGAEAARRVLDANGLSGVAVEQIRGSLTDHYDPSSNVERLYDPSKKVLRLSETVYGRESVAAVSVACHEAGHALQDAENYGPLKLRNGMVPIVNFSSKFCWILIFAGIILSAAGTYMAGWIFDIGIILFVAVILFHLVTLPVEFNASRRAMDQMELAGIIDSDEERGAKKVLSAAAMTYVASLAVAVAQLLRLLAMRGRD